jgi:hypothetical protein
LGWFGKRGRIRCKIEEVAITSIEYYKKLGIICIKILKIYTFMDIHRLRNTIIITYNTRTTLK